MSERNDIKKDYWNTLYELKYAHISAPEKGGSDIPEDEISEDVVLSPNGDSIKCTQTLSSDKIQILNQLKSQKMLESIDANLKTIKTYISITFWISVSSAAFLILYLLVKLL